jgi:hypothetical protein
MRRLHRLVAWFGVVLLIAAMSAACSTARDVGEVVVHEWDPNSEDGNPWVGLIWEPSDDGEILFLGEPTFPHRQHVDALLT